MLRILSGIHLGSGLVRIISITQNTIKQNILCICVGFGSGLVRIRFGSDFWVRFIFLALLSNVFFCLLSLRDPFQCLLVIHTKWVCEWCYSKFQHVTRWKTNKTTSKMSNYGMENGEIVVPVGTKLLYNKFLFYKLMVTWIWGMSHHTFSNFMVHCMFFYLLIWKIFYKKKRKKHQRWVGLVVKELRL